jgi:hypothetical protein
MLTLRGQKVVTLLKVGVVVLGLGFVGCSNGAESIPLSPREFRQKVLQLKQGANAKSVKAELGEPVSEFAEPVQRTTLNYRSWQLFFDKEGLERRVRQKRPFPRRLTTANSSFDSSVQELQRGMSVASVRRRLGTPEWYEEAFEENPDPEIILRYGPWEVIFIHGKLAYRMR